MLALLLLPAIGAVAASHSASDTLASRAALPSCACAPAVDRALATTAAVPPAAAPSLVLFLVVDQFRADYVDRFGPDFHFGFRRLLDRGLLYARAAHDHGVTETAPGHAALATGRHPSRTGILSNDRGVPDRAFALVGGTGTGASPARLRGTTLYDWMRAADPSADAFSVSRKDRGAILPVGRGGRHVYWLLRGSAVTSRWYADSLPSWVREWNARRPLDRLAGTTWTTLLPDSAYPERDDYDFEHRGTDARFPHRLPGTADSLGDVINDYPWTDSLTLDFALEGVRRLGLGRRGRADFVNVSLSTTDAIGHLYGPHSRELHDHLLRLDRWLGRFLDSLQVLVPGEVAIVLSSDHGTQPMPEYQRALGRSAHLVRTDTLVNRWAARLRDRWNTEFDLEMDSGLLYADTVALRSRGVNVAALADSVASDLRRMAGIARVYTPRSLASATSSTEVRRWRHGVAPHIGWLTASVTVPGSTFGWRVGNAQHGTTHDEDALVPMLFVLPGLTPGRVARPIRTVDLAPTLAAWLGIRPTEAVDGVVLPEVVAPRK
jgi:hypothetical protein